MSLPYVKGSYDSGLRETFDTGCIIDGSHLSADDANREVGYFTVRLFNKLRLPFFVNVMAEDLERLSNIKNCRPPIELYTQTLREIANDAVELLNSRTVGGSFSLDDNSLYFLSDADAEQFED